MKIKCIIINHFDYEEDETELPIKKEQIIATRTDWLILRKIDEKVPQLTIWYMEDE